MDVAGSQSDGAGVQQWTCDGTDDQEFPYQARCWEVQYDTGVHTHIEMYNENYTPMNDGYACYRDYTLGNWMGYLTEFGHIGRTRYPGIRAVCTPPS